MDIITLTLNPAFDVHCHTADFRAGVENLATVLSRDAGGKGVNISRALHACGVESTALVALGEENGADFLRALEKERLQVRALWVAGRIRENLTLHTDGGRETRISFAGFPVDGTLLERMDAAMGAHLSDAIVTLTGRVPEGISMAALKRFLGVLRARGARLVIDSKSFSTADLIECRPWLIKPNEEEVRDCLFCSAEDPTQLLSGARRLCEAGIGNVMVSLGERGAMLVCHAGAWLATPPAIAAISTIGAGDSAIAGFLSAAREGKDAPTCLRRAVAYGSAACLTEGTQPPQRDCVAALEGEISLSPL